MEYTLKIIRIALRVKRNAKRMRDVELFGVHQREKMKIMVTVYGGA